MLPEAIFASYETFVLLGTKLQEIYEASLDIQYQSKYAWLKKAYNTGVNNANANARHANDKKRNTFIIASINRAFCRQSQFKDATYDNIVDYRRIITQEDKDKDFHRADRLENIINRTIAVGNNYHIENDLQKTLLCLKDYNEFVMSMSKK